MSATHEFAITQSAMPELREQLRFAVAAGDEHDTHRVLATLFEKVVFTVREGTLGELSELREQLRRVSVVVLERLEDDPAELKGDVEAELTRFDRLLKTAVQFARVREAADHRQQATRTLPERILEAASSGPCRPRDLVVRCGSDLPQVSRAVAALVETGKLRALDTPPAGSHDGRARWYELADPV